MTRILALPLVLITALLMSCGDDEPITVAEQNGLTAMIDGAASHLQESDRFAKLIQPHVPSLDTAAEFHRQGEDAMQLISDSIVATTRNDSAEVLFTITVAVDSVTREKRDAFVYMVKEGNDWKGAGAYIVE